MINRKKGETHKQFIQRLEAYVANVEENNRVLRKLNTGGDLLNPRTGKSYRDEAEELFITVALTDATLRDNNPSYAKAMVQGQLLLSGFNEVEIVTNECLKDGAYNGKKST